MEHEEYSLKPLEYGLSQHQGGVAPPPGGPGAQRLQHRNWQGTGQELLPPGGDGGTFTGPPPMMMYTSQPWPVTQSDSSGRPPQHNQVLQRFRTEAEAILQAPYPTTQGRKVGGGGGGMQPPAAPSSVPIMPPPMSRAMPQSSSRAAVLPPGFAHQQDYDDQENQKKGSNVEAPTKGRRGGSMLVDKSTAAGVSAAAAVAAHVAAWSNKETKRVPTLGQMAAQVQASAQAKMKASGLTELEDVKAILGDQNGPLHVCTPGTEHTGRWTRAEHERFVAALKRYGKEWKRVAASVKTRTVVQTRTHAQKYFQKLQKQMATGMKLEEALESCMDDSDVDSDDGGGKSGGRVVRRKGTARSQSKAAAAAAANVQAALLPPAPPKRRSNSGRVYVKEEAVPVPMPTQAPYGEVPIPDLDVGDAAFYGNEEEDEAIYGVLEEEVGRGLEADELNDEEEQAMLEGAVETMHHMHGDHGLPPGNFPLSITVPEDMMSQSHDFPPWQCQPPQPSPAASGKRKYAELAAAEVLCAAVTQENPRVPMTGPSALNGEVGDVAATAAAAAAAAHRPRKIMCLKNRKQLQITNPDMLEKLDNPFLTAAGAQTPWDTEVRALTAFGGLDSFPDDEGPLRSPVWQRLQELVCKGDVENAKVLLDNSRRMPGSTLSQPETSTEGTMDASSAGMIEHAENALNLSVVDDNGKSLLMMAASLDPLVVDPSRATDLCQALIEHSPSVVNIKDRTLCTALHWAARAGNAQVIKLLVSRGCPLNAQDLAGETALHWASRGVKVEAIKELIASGSSTHLRNNGSRSALDVAAAGYQEEGSQSTKSSPQGSPQHVVQRGQVEEAVACEQREMVRRIIFEAEPRMRTLVVYHHECIESTTASSKKDSWETGHRVETIMSRLKDTTSFPPSVVDITSSFERASVETVSRVHSAEYLQYVHELSQEASQQGSGPITFHPFIPKSTITGSPSSSAGNSPRNAKEAPMYMCAGTLNAARRSAGAVITAVDHVMSGRNRNAFCVVRPPGHHIGVNGLKQITASVSGCGLSIFNNVAIGALHALDRCERVAIIDIDAHHGDGTEDVVRSYPENNRLLFFSIHLYDKGSTASQESSGEKELTAATKESGASSSVTSDFYPGTGDKDELVHNIYNVPMNPLWKARGDPVSGNTRNTYTGRADFRWVITERLIPALRSFNPKLIILSTGFDGLDRDVGNAKHVTSPGGSEPLPIAGLDLTVEDFGWVTRKLQEVADMCCHGRMISVLEGGFGCLAPGESHGALDVTSVGSAAAAHVSAMIDPYPFKEEGEVRSEGTANEQGDSGRSI